MNPVHELFKRPSYIVLHYRSCNAVADAIQRFFSIKPFIVLSRLTYGAYLTHTMGQLYDQGSLRVPRYLSAYTGVSRHPTRHSVNHQIPFITVEFTLHA